jgi:hypothetical protein
MVLKICRHFYSTEPSEQHGTEGCVLNLHNRRCYWPTDMKFILKNIISLQHHGPRIIFRFVLKEFPHTITCKLLRLLELTLHCSDYVT